MKEYHLLYTLPGGRFVNEHRSFVSFRAAEAWLKYTGALYWEIGF